MIKVCPSSNPCPENELIEYIRELENLGVEYLHCDVMDGEFVSNSCLRDMELLHEIRNNTNILFDVHLMVSNTFEEVKKYSQLRPVIITFHYESPRSAKEIIKICKYLKEKQILVGMSIKPNTPVCMLEPFIDYLDLVLIMSVEPGRSGQTFIPESIDRIKELKSLIGDRKVIIEVDGGINENNYSQIVDAGAEFLVMGNAFYTSKNRAKLLKTIDKHYV